MEKEPFKHKDKSRYRDTYLVGPHKDHVAKVPKEKLEKHYPFGDVSYPMSPYTLLKFGTTNVNEADKRNYDALPESIRKEFTPAMRVIRGIVVQERVMNFDGTPSLSIEQHTKSFGKIENAYFWDKVDQLKDILGSEDTPLLGVFHRGSNILVKKTSEDRWVPIIIDFKRLGARSYPFQPNLALPGQVRKKFLRQFEDFESAYRPQEE